MPNAKGVRTIKLVVQYDGSDFVGWQRQGKGVSVQGLIEEALATIDGAPVTLHGAGRTDAGVHAIGQVASARVTSPIEDWQLVRALNAHLPKAIFLINDAKALRIRQLAIFRIELGQVFLNFRFFLGCLRGLCSWRNAEP